MDVSLLCDPKPNLVGYRGISVSFGASAPLFRPGIIFGAALAFTSFGVFRVSFLTTQLGTERVSTLLATRGSESPIESFNDVLDSLKFLVDVHGVYYRFEAADSKVVWDEKIQSAISRVWPTAKTAFPLASCSKLFTSFAAMRTMQLKPNDFYPSKYIHEFKGWERFRDFPAYGYPGQTFDLTIHHLLTHTSGLPFGLRDSKLDIQRQTLFFKPGTRFGYTLGHRVIGWVLRDFWSDQPETLAVNITSVQETFRWLIFEPLGLSSQTEFIGLMSELFGFEGEAGDAAIQSTGNDMMKLAIVALRRGKLPSGEEFITESNWNKWAVPNLLPDGMLTKDLVDYQDGEDWTNLNFFGLKDKIMKQSGNYGYNYFGATYFASKEVGWCGFLSSCLHISYHRQLAFIMMQYDMDDVKRSKLYMINHFDAIAESLQCHGKHHMYNGTSAVYCEHCPIDTYSDCHVFGLASSKLGCSNDTASTCTFAHCDPILGPTYCVKPRWWNIGHCVCKPGYCAAAGGGQCVATVESHCPSNGFRARGQWSWKVKQTTTHVCYVPTGPPSPWCENRTKHGQTCRPGFCADELRNNCVEHGYPEPT